MIEVVMTRDSVCMADDVNSPHEQTFVLADGADLIELAQAIARSSYLPMPSDAWGWTIEAQGVVVAVRRGLFHRLVETLRGDPSSVTIANEENLCALYVRPNSPWRNA